MRTGGTSLKAERGVRAGRRFGAFTLVEILIVVVILGILAAMVVPQYVGATEDAQKGATVDQLSKLRRALDVYFVRNNNQYPQVTEGNGTWGELVIPGSVYLKQAPMNDYVAGANSKVIKFGTAADTAYTTQYGWVYDPATGQVWAASFDAGDAPLPKP